MASCTLLELVAGENHKSWPASLLETRPGALLITSQEYLSPDVLTEEASTDNTSYNSLVERIFN